MKIKALNFFLGIYIPYYNFTIFKAPVDFVLMHTDASDGRIFIFLL